MNINIPSGIEARFNRFQNTGQLDPAAKNEKLDETVVGGAAFVISTMAGTYASMDETEFDMARGQVGYVDVSPEALKSDPEVFNAKEAQAQIDSKSGNVTVESTTLEGNKAYTRYFNNGDEIGMIGVEISPNQTEFEGMLIADNGGQVSSYIQSNLES
jgi:hypothetical protein